MERDMVKKKEIGVIGLGKFGFSLAEALTTLGHAVVGVDSSEDHVKRAQNKLAQVFKADATDEKALEQIGFKDLDKVIVSTGDSMEASILVVLNLQSIGVEEIWVKAISEEHQRVLYKLGVDHVVFPEAFVAYQLAHQLTNLGINDYFGLGVDVATKEIVVDKWAGKNLRELDLTNTFHIQVVAFRKRDEAEFSFVPKADLVFEEGDVVVLIGKSKDMARIDKY